MVLGPCLGFVASGGTAVSRAEVNKRNPTRMLLEPNTFFLLSDLSQISEIVVRTIGAAAEEQVALAVTAQEASEAGSGLGAVAVDAVLTGVFEPLDPLLPMPTVVVQVAALYYVWGAFLRLWHPARTAAAKARRGHPARCRIHAAGRACRRTTHVCVACAACRMLQPPRRGS